MFLAILCDEMASQLEPNPSPTRTPTPNPTPTPTPPLNPTPTQASQLEQKNMAEEQQKKVDNFAPISPLHLPYTSPTSPLYLPYISPISPWPGARRAARELQHALAARVRPEWRGEPAQANPNPKPSPSPHPSPSPSQASPSPHPSPSPDQASRRKLPDRCDQAWFVRSFCSGEGGCAPEAG